MFFDFGRSEKFPTIYESNLTSVTVDVLEAGFITAFVILLLCFYVALLKHNIKNFFTHLRITVSLLLGLFILLGNFGQEWEVSHIKTNTTYKSGSKHEIIADIGIKIGLRSINVTLKSDIEDHKALPNEVINYNERLHWTWDQGRFGFGPYAGTLQQEFRAAQYRGLPLPILWVIDYFVIDGEGYRHGRFYRTAGWYAHIAIWTAFPCWLMANILFRSVIRYGAYFLLIGGVLQLTANLIWCVVRNPNSLIIPFENATMTTKYGLSFWLNFSTGLTSVLLSILLIIMERYFEEELYEYFGVDSLNVYDVYTSEEVQEATFMNKGADIEMRPQSLERNPEFIHIARKSHHKPRIPPKANKRPQTEQLAEDDIYENVQTEFRR